MQTQIRLLLEKQSDLGLPCCYNDKHFANSSPDNQHYIWENKRKIVWNFGTFTSFRIYQGCLVGKNIRIHHECEGGIEKSVPRTTDWYHEACLVMTNGDGEGQTFISHPHTNNGFFFLITTKSPFSNRKTKKKKASRKSWKRWDVTWWRQWRHGSTCGQSVTIHFYLSHGLVRVCEIELSHMCKNNGNPYLVYENIGICYGCEGWSQRSPFDIDITSLTEWWEMVILRDCFLFSGHSHEW